jgi:hypothetical protein
VKQLIIIMTLCIGCIHVADAQSSFIQRLQQKKSGEGKVTVTQDKTIDELVNGKGAAQLTPTPAVTPKPRTIPEKTATPVAVAAKKQQEHTAPATKKESHHEHAATTTTKREPQQDTTQQKTDTTTVKKPKRTYKVTGYRVQVFAGGNSRKDRTQAEEMGMELRTLFPTEAVYVHFYPPRWICRMGNYRTYEEAHQTLQEVKKLGYQAATIVKGKITVSY